MSMATGGARSDTAPDGRGGGGTGWGGHVCSPLSSLGETVKHLILHRSSTHQETVRSLNTCDPADSCCAAICTVCTALWIQESDKGIT